MGLKIKTAEKAAEPQTKEVVSEDEALKQKVDDYNKRFDALEKKKKAFASKISEEVESLSNLLSEFSAMTEDLEATEELVLKGTKTYVGFGKKAKVTEVKNKQKLVEFFGLDNFIQVAGVKLGDIRKYLTPGQVSEVLDERNEGNRSFSRGTLADLQKKK